MLSNPHTIMSGYCSLSAVISLHAVTFHAQLQRNKAHINMGAIVQGNELLIT